ncbi:MAG: thioredoxin domain-containing protein [Planctomycetota bacterium]
MRNAIVLAGVCLVMLVTAVSIGEEPQVQTAAAAPAIVTVAEAHPFLTTGTLSQARLADLPEGVILQAEGVEITADSLAPEIARAPEAMRGQLNNNLFFVLEQAATEKLLIAAARKAGAVKEGTPDRDAIQAYLEGIAATVAMTEAEVAQYYEANKAACGGATLEDMRSMLADYVLKEKKQAAVEAHIATLGDRMEIRVDRAWAGKQAQALDSPVDKARAGGLPVMVDFGAHGCGPCDMMTPILADMQKALAGKADVLFVPVREEQILAARYGIRSIPVQVFFDKAGREIYRHTGFFPQAECEAWLKKAGLE